MKGLLVAALVLIGCEAERSTGLGQPAGGEGGQGGQGGPGDGSGGPPAPGAGDEGEGEVAGDAPDEIGEGEAEGPGGEGEEPGAACVEGALRCASDGLPQQCSGGVWFDAFPCDEGFWCIDGRCSRVEQCEPGEIEGCVDDRSLRVCADSGRGFGPRECPADNPLCWRGQCGHQICEQADRRCRGQFTIEECDGDGTGWNGVDSCDPQEDEVCHRGECVRGCLVAAKTQSYLGCEFWSVDLPQYDDPGSDPDAAPHAVVVANTGQRLARVVVETRSGAVVPRPVEIPPGDARVVPFPRLDVDGTGRSLNSFRLSASEPVIAYQFNPLNNVHVFSNDASLLLPSNAIGKDYRVMSWPGGPPLDLLGLPAQTAWFTVVATAAGTTTLRLTFSCDIVDGGEFADISRGDVLDVEMEQWEVLNFEAQTTIAQAMAGDIGDVTGSRVQSDQPVVVFAGHKEAVIGEDGPEGSNCCADHLEQQLFPVPAWGATYLAVHSPPRGTEPDYWRVLAAEDGTQISTVPPIADLHGITLNAGEFRQIHTAQSFEVIATAPVLVGQFLASQQSAGVDDVIGDPAFLLSVPVEQFRSDYGVLTPDNYARDYITVIKPIDAVVDLDGAELPGGDFTPFGSGDFTYLHVPVQPGSHALVSVDDVPFGVAAFGYDSAVSYGYPGGLDLTRADDE